MSTPLGTLSKKNYAGQAIWWLNGFWEAGAREEANAVWEVLHDSSPPLSSPVDRSFSDPLFFAGLPGLHEA
jgi:hypothetical protein